MSSPAPPTIPVFAIPGSVAPDLGAWLGLIIEGLCRAVAARRSWNPVATARLVLTWSHLRRLARRFEILAARVQAGSLPRRPTSPRPASPASPERPDGSPERSRERLRERLSQGYAWLIRLVPGAASFGSQLQNFLSQPETVALLAASPQAVRLLRPLCRMLAAHPTPPLPPLPARAPRKSRRKPPPEPDPEPDSELRRVARSHWTSVCPPGRVRGSPWPSPGLGSFRLPPRHLRRD